MKLILTGHAKEQMDLRGIDETQVITALKRGSRSKQTGGYLAVYGCVAVAYLIRRNRCIVKTVMII